MKKQFLTVAVAALALAGCSKNETVEVASNRAIGFDAFVGKATRAVTETDVNALKAGFFVYGGYEENADVFFDTKVTSADGSEWTYSPIRYWVKDETYKFAAYAPEAVKNNGSVSFDYTSGALTVTDYQATQDNQADFVYAKSEPIPGLASGNDEISLTFAHMLSMVKFTFKNAFGNGVKVDISNVAINGIKTKATCTDGNWTAPSDATEFTKASFPQMTTNGAISEEEIVIIPQTIQKDAVTVTFNLTVTTEDGTKVADNVNKTAKLEAITWDKNNRYNYILTIDGKIIGLEEIIFGQPDVTPWDDYNTPGTDVTVQ